MHSCKKITAFIILLLYAAIAFGQASEKNNTVTRQRKSTSFGKVVSAPAILICSGLIVMTDNDMIDRYKIEKERNEHFSKFRTHVDDYLQYTPAAAVYGLNICGVKGKNNFGNRTALLIKSELIMTAIVCPLKKITAVPRPDTGAPNSFPSGHTAQVFAAATFMAKEYGGKSIWSSIGAYSVATGVGVLRVMNNRHWFSDVLAGAGIGILSTNLAYLTHQYKWTSKHKDKKAKAGGLMIVPSYSGNTFGVYAHYTF
jgi:hypothetical protein